MRTPGSRKGVRAALPLALLAFAASAFDVRAAAISLEPLQRDGYGVVALKRPQPNVLTVEATVNGRKARLIVDTGWSGDGITLDSSFASVFKTPSESIKDFGRSASGAELTGVTKNHAETVTLGNVSMKQVPVYCLSLAALRHDSMRRRVGGDGFISAGFLRTCSGIIDLHNLRLYLRPPGTGRRAEIGAAMHGAGLSAAPFTMGPSHAVLVDVEINGASGKMIIDTGAALAGVDERMGRQMKTGAYNSRTGTIDAAGKISRSKWAKIQSFKIGGISARAPDLRIEHYAFYGSTGGKVVGLLGMDILGSNGAVIDFGAQKLYFYGR
jgi:predicted aspartyl protease